MVLIPGDRIAQLQVELVAAAAQRKQAEGGLVLTEMGWRTEIAWGSPLGRVCLSAPSLPSRALKPLPLKPEARLSHQPRKSPTPNLMCVRDATTPVLSAVLPPHCCFFTHLLCRMESLQGQPPSQRPEHLSFDALFNNKAAEMEFISLRPWDNRGSRHSTGEMCF